TAFRVGDRDDDCDQHDRSAWDRGTGGNVRRQTKKTFRPTNADSETAQEKEDFADTYCHTSGVSFGKRSADFFAKWNSTSVDHAIAISERNGDRRAERNAATCSIRSRNKIADSKQGRSNPIFRSGPSD